MRSGVGRKRAWVYVCVRKEAFVESDKRVSYVGLRTSRLIVCARVELEAGGQTGMR